MRMWDHPLFSLSFTWFYTKYVNTQVDWFHGFYWNRENCRKINMMRKWFCSKINENLRMKTNGIFWNFRITFLDIHACFRQIFRESKAFERYGFRIFLFSYFFFSERISRFTKLLCAQYENWCDLFSFAHLWQKFREIDVFNKEITTVAIFSNISWNQFMSTRCVSGLWPSLARLRYGLQWFDRNELLDATWCNLQTNLKSGASDSLSLAMGIRCSSDK